MAEIVYLHDGDARAGIVPAFGGGMEGLWVGDKPVLRSWDRGEPVNPSAMALFILTPFSNRIAGGFRQAGEWIALAPNREGETYPIHGDGFAKAWRVSERSERHLALTLENGAFGPWKYRARLSYRLHAQQLDIDLELANRGDAALPFGLGFHPFFPRSADTLLQFEAEAVWEETADHMVKGERPVAIPEDWRFERFRALPDRLINNGFSGWPGAARIRQGADAVCVTLGASALLNTALVYSPSAKAEFFCFEPVSHPVDAINLAGRPGLVDLAPGEAMAARMHLNWDRALNDF